MYEIVNSVLNNQILSEYICSKILSNNINSIFSWALLRNSLEPKKRPAINQWQSILELLLLNGYVIIVKSGIVKRIL